MYIMMIGQGALTRPLAALATRAGITIVEVDHVATGMLSSARSEMAVVVGDREAAMELVAGVRSSLGDDIVVVDATTTVTSDQSDGEEDLASESEWMALLSSTRVVRGFASVPAEAFTLIAERGATDEPIELAVPFAGDDVDAKQLVSDFMRRIGVEPVDLGPLTVSYAMEPGGPLWGKAVDALDMQECIGWLSGDG